MADPKLLEVLKGGTSSLNAWRGKHPDAEVDLRGAHLGGISLARAELKEANLFGAKLNEADLSEADLTNADMRGVDMRGAKLKGTCFLGVDLRVSKLTRADFSGAVLTEANLIESDLWGADLSGAHLFRSDLRGANMVGADMSGANLSGANLVGANLNEAVLSWANLAGAHLSGANLMGTDLSGANLSGAHLFGANLNEAGLMETSCYRTEFQNCIMRGAKLIGTNLCMSDLTGTDITGAMFWGCRTAGWKIDGIKAEYMYLTSILEERENNRKDFLPGEFEKRYSSHEQTLEIMLGIPLEVDAAYYGCTIAQSVNSLHGSSVMALRTIEAISGTETGFDFIFLDDDFFSGSRHLIEEVGSQINEYLRKDPDGFAREAFPRLPSAVTEKGESGSGEREASIPLGHGSNLHPGTLLEQLKTGCTSAGKLGEVFYNIIQDILSE